MILKTSCPTAEEVQDRTAEMATIPHKDRHSVETNLEYISSLMNVRQEDKHLIEIIRSGDKATDLISSMYRQRISSALGG